MSIVVTSDACAALPSVQAPAPTQTGTVAHCEQYYVPQQGEYCRKVADALGLNVDVFMAWNPAVIPPTCPSLLAGYAYCMRACTYDHNLATEGSMHSVARGSTLSELSAGSSPMGTLTAESVQPSAVPASSSPSATAALSSQCSSRTYKNYTGDGSLADGWPSVSDWVDFDCMVELNWSQMQAACSQWGVENNSDSEMKELQRATQQVAAETGVDARFIWAIMIQESTGCVRVITTEYSVFNPGVLQSHNGTGSCNRNSESFDIPGSDAITANVQTPCAYAEIYQMLLDGTQGTASGDGLLQCLEKQGHTDTSRWYRAARMYNGGSISNSADLSQGCCTASYVSDIANRLTGWTTAEESFES